VVGTFGLLSFQTGSAAWPVTPSYPPSEATLEFNKKKKLKVKEFFIKFL
jgi:hypothetical protein